MRHGPERPGVWHQLAAPHDDSPEYGTNTNHTGYIWTIDTTDPAKPFLLSKWKLPATAFFRRQRARASLHSRRIHLQPAQRRHRNQRARVLDALHAGNWVTDHSNIWKDTVWVDGVPAPEVGFPAIKEFAETITLGYSYRRPRWIEDPRKRLDTTWPIVGLHA